MSIAIAGSKLRATLDHSLMYLPHVFFKFAYNIFVVHCGYPLDDFGTFNLGSAHDIELPQPWRTPQCPWRMLPPLRSRLQCFLCFILPNAGRLCTEHRNRHCTEVWCAHSCKFCRTKLHPMTEWLACSLANVCTFQDRFCVHNRRFALSLVVISWLPQMRHLPNKISASEKTRAWQYQAELTQGTKTGPRVQENEKTDHLKQSAGVVGSKGSPNAASALKRRMFCFGRFRTNSKLLSLHLLFLVYLFIMYLFIRW